MLFDQSAQDLHDLVASSDPPTPTSQVWTGDGAVVSATTGEDEEDNRLGTDRRPPGVSEEHGRPAGAGTMYDVANASGLYLLAAGPVAAFASPKFPLRPNAHPR